MISLCLLLLAFAIIHSWTASGKFKGKIKSWIGENAFDRYYRIAYNLISLITFVPLFYLAITESPMVWAVEGNWRIIFRVIQLMAIAGITLSLYQVDWREFIGLRQHSLSADSRAKKESKLVIKGMYKLVRHPLYVFSILLIWVKADMSQNWMVFCLGCTAYFLIGSYFEEKKMLREFGQTYRDYQKKVFWIF